MTCESAVFSDMSDISFLTDVSRYPPNMMPGCHITLHTTATDDRQARLLLGAIGIPFYGKLVN